MNHFSIFLCFEGNTKILTADGLQSISNIKCGATIQSFDIKSNSICTDIVSTTAHSLHSICAIIGFEDGSSLMATVDHPIYVIGKGWCAVKTDNMEETYGVSVKQLKEGDACIQVKNNAITSSKVQNIEIKNCSERFYCLSTKEHHNFIANNTLVHDVDINRFSQECIKQEGIIVEHLQK